MENILNIEETLERIADSSDARRMPVGYASSGTVCSIEATNPTPTRWVCKPKNPKTSNRTSSSPPQNIKYYHIYIKFWCPVISPELRFCRVESSAILVQEIYRCPLDKKVLAELLKCALDRGNPVPVYTRPEKAIQVKTNPGKTWTIVWNSNLPLFQLHFKGNNSLKVFL